MQGQYFEDSFCVFIRIRDFCEFIFFTLLENKFYCTYIVQDMIIKIIY